MAREFDHDDTPGRGRYNPRSRPENSGRDDGPPFGSESMSASRGRSERDRLRGRYPEHDGAGDVRG